MRVPLIPTTLTRDQTIGRQFFDDGHKAYAKGNWTVLSLNKTDPTEFQCKRLSGGRKVGEVIAYDVGTVMRKVKETAWLQTDRPKFINT